MDVRAWLEVDVQGPIHRTLAGRLQGLLFSVLLTSLAVEAFACQEAARVEHHRPDHRVGARGVISLARQLQGARSPLHVYARVVVCAIQFWQIYPRRI